MITIYERGAADLTTLGKGILRPSECTIEEEAAGLYEAHLLCPAEEATLVRPGCILRMDAPVRETPELEIAGESATTVRREIWRVTTADGSGVYLRARPNGTTICLCPSGTLVIKTGVCDQSGWWKVAVVGIGQAGCMYSSYLSYVETKEETVTTGAPSTLVQARTTRQQLFRVYSVTRDAACGLIDIRARHLTYDIGDCIVGGTYCPDGVPASVVCRQLMEMADHDSGITIVCPCGGLITADYTGRSLMDCLLNPKDGIAAQLGARVVRDHFDLFILPDTRRYADVHLRGGVNIIALSLTEDDSACITRLRPLGVKADGTPLTIDGYVDSPRAADLGIRAAAIRYDVSARDLGESAAKALLRQLAQSEYDLRGIDRPERTLEAEVVSPGTEQMHLYDDVRVYEPALAISEIARLTGYVYDVLAGRYIAVRLNLLNTD